jgi:predicted N-acetyltransferase YhbS
MPAIQIYPSSEALPPEYDCQIRSFIRMTWHDAYEYDLNAPLTSPEIHAQHVVMAEQHVVISHARVSWVLMEHAGQTYKLYCLGDMLTYPAFRHRGYGQQVVKAATDLIKADATADAAILLTDPELEGFYGQSGWEHIDGMAVLKGSRDEPIDYDSFAMMLFLSPQGEAGRAAFTTQTVFLPGYAW